MDATRGRSDWILDEGGEPIPTVSCRCRGGLGNVQAAKGGRRGDLVLDGGDGGERRHRGVHAGGFQFVPRPRQDRCLLLGGKQDVEASSPVHLHGRGQPGEGIRAIRGHTVDASDTAREATQAQRVGGEHLNEVAGFGQPGGALASREARPVAQQDSHEYKSCPNSLRTDTEDRPRPSSRGGIRPWPTVIGWGRLRGRRGVAWRPDAGRGGRMEGADTAACGVT